jgi:hypothetical protein
MKPGATLTDVGSTKANVAEAFRAQDRSKIFVIPGHPIAGTEQSGPDAGFAELFENRWTILTPAESDDEPTPPPSPSSVGLLARLRGPGRADGRESTTTWCWPSSATCPT